MPKIIKKPLVGKYGACWTPGRTQAADHILLHHTASGGSGGHGGADAVWNYQYAVPPGSRTSENYIVGKDGSIIEAVAPKNTAWHAGSSEWNARSIGIEIVNLGNGKDPYPDVQVKAVAWLCKYLMAKYPVIDVKPLKTVDGHQRLGDIWEHSEVCAGKIDMSANFPWQRLYNYIADPLVTVKVRRSLWSAFKAWREKRSA